MNIENCTEEAGTDIIHLNVTAICVLECFLSSHVLIALSLCQSVMVLCSSLLQGKEAAAPSKPQRSRQQTGDKMADDDNRVSSTCDDHVTTTCYVQC